MSSPPVVGLATGLYVPSQTPVEDKLTTITELRRATEPNPDAGVLVAALYAFKQPAVFEFICTQLARCDVQELEYFVPQLWYVPAQKTVSRNLLSNLRPDLLGPTLGPWSMHFSGSDPSK
jgi:hypothetical protein